MAQVLLIGEDWKARALLRAQLIEEGITVEAYQTVSEALASVQPSATIPLLLLADLSASSDPAAEADELAPWTNRIPTWIIASRGSFDSEDLLRRGFERVLFRPIDLGQLVEQIKRRLKRE